MIRSEMLKKQALLHSSKNSHKSTVRMCRKLSCCGTLGVRKCGQNLVMKVNNTQMKAYVLKTI